MEEAVSLELTPDEAARITREQRENKAAKSKNLLEVKGLSTHFFTPDGVVRAVDDVSFELGYGETLGLVGESGCGKSVTALSLTRLIPNPPGKIVSGSVVFDGVDLLKLSDDGMRKLRGKEIGFIFQDPLTSLNPTLTIGYQIAESIRQHMGLSKKASYDRVVELLGKVGIPTAILAEATLAYIGIGVQPPRASWGTLIAEGQGFIRSYPWLTLFPGILIATSLMSFTFLGDGLRDALDPKLKGKQ